MKLLKVEQREDKRMYLEIEIDSAQFEEAMERSYKKNVKQINIPGFRKGKAPRKIIEKYYTEAIFYDDAINFAVPGAYDKAVEESGIEPVEMPEIDIVKLEKGENFVFSALVTVRPEVTLGEYKGLTAEKEGNTVKLTKLMRNSRSFRKTLQASKQLLKAKSLWATRLTLISKVSLTK